MRWSLPHTELSFLMSYTLWADFGAAFLRVTVPVIVPPLVTSTTL